MKRLLWKEFRELRAVLLLGVVAFPVLLGLLRMPKVADGFGTDRTMYGMFVAMIAAVALGAGQVASERSAKTLDYLLGRPVVGRQVVLAKFVAGSTVLLIFVAPILALSVFGGETSDYWLQTARGFGYTRALVYQFPMCWFVYSCTLLFSTIVEQRAQAIAGGLFCLVAVVSVAISVPSIWPLLLADIWFPHAMAEASMLAVALASTRETSLWVAVPAVWSALAILVAAVAAIILERRWEVRVSWPVIGLLFIVIGAGSYFVRTPAVKVQPTGVYSLQTRAASDPAVDGNGVDDQVSGPVVDGSRVSVATKEGLVVVDFSDPAHPRQLGQIRLPLWTIERWTFAGNDIYVAGRHKDLPVDTAGVLRVRMHSAGLWDATQIVNLGPMDSQAWIGRPQVSGKHLYLGTAAGQDSRLRVFELSADGPARQTAEVAIEHWPREPRPNPYYGRPQFALEIRGTYAYLAGFKELVTLELGDPSNPRVVHRSELGDAMAAAAERNIASIGNRLYVHVFLPPMLRRYDLQDPAQPVEKGRTFWGRAGGALVADEGRSRLFVGFHDGVLAFPPPEGPWIRDVRYFKGKIDVPARVRTLSVTAAGGFFYVLIDKRQVAAYAVPRYEEL